MDSFTGSSRAAAINQKLSHLLISDFPRRTIAIADASHALVLQHTPPNGDPNPQASAKCMVDFSTVSERDLADFRPLTPRPICGTLGLISMGRDVFLCVVTHAIRVANVRPGETVERIGNVEFFCLNSSRYDDFYAMNSYAMEYSELSRRDALLEHPCQDLQKLLGDGSFYYSTDFDLTNRLQDRSADAGEFEIENFDEAFLWNSFMIRPLLDFRSKLLDHEREALDTSRILTSAIRGFCQTLSIPQSSAPLRSESGLPSLLTVVSRLSCRRAGTRFNARGIDDDGNVANFVETETIYWTPSGILFSYAQVRGSVPIFWEQAAGLKPGQQKITVTRNREGAQPAFNRHFDDLEQNYGAVHVLNLLSEIKSSEAELTDLYRCCLGHCPLTDTGEKRGQGRALIRATEYDFHAETKGPDGYMAAQGIERHISQSVDGFAYYLCEPVDGTSYYTGGHARLTVVLQQEGIFRTNCLDCLDRTNLIQTIVSQLAVKSFLEQKRDYAAPTFFAHHDTLWADNGDALSKIYAGTGALKSSFTRHGKMSIAGAFADARKSAERLFINNFADKGRQQTIDTLLGRVVGQIQVSLFDPISDFAVHELRQRQAEFSSKKSIKMLVGTFNLNGRTEGIQEDLSSWLRPVELGVDQPEIVVVGFQEIVELSPQQIMNSDPRRKQLWESAVKNTLNLHHTEEKGGENYVLLRSGQLVGAALCIFVKASVLPIIKNVEGSIKKTGMSGVAGNKGAVAIRMDYASTQLCFVTAHLAAGFTNYEERNRDYVTIHEGLHFQRNRRIPNHDTVIWLGDFNYRIGLGNEVARDLVKRSDIETMYANDQLNLQMLAGNAFQHYSEAKITFLPTYKFNIGTDTYDTSEKARIPAWTDRILRKGTNIRQLCYNSAPLKFSDHRPVYAIFECTVTMIDTERREKISRQIYNRKKAELNGDSSTVNNSGDTDDEDLLGYETVEPGLPKASSDSQKWWLESRRMAQSQVKPPGQMILNPRRPSNPFPKSEELDWVPVSRPTSYCSVASSQFEHIATPNNSNPLSSYTGMSGPRKLPPQYDDVTALSAKIGRLNLTEEPPLSKNQKQKPPPPPPRRREDTNYVARTTDSNIPPKPQPVPPLGKENQNKAQAPVPPPPGSDLAISRNTEASKRPPPVAKKPAHLKSDSPVHSFPPQNEKKFAPAGEEEKKPALPARVSKSSSASGEVAGRFDHASKINVPAHKPGIGDDKTALSGTGENVVRGKKIKGKPPPPTPARKVATVGPTAMPGMTRQEQGSGSKNAGINAAATPPNVETATTPKNMLPTQMQIHTDKQRQVDLLGEVGVDGSQIKGWEIMKPV